jgi:cellulose synthase/poly-beta-1,6-N-acetylglucosamine synthase-like glycosyltransferase
MRWLHWIPAALLGWTHVLYGIALRALPEHPTDAADISPTVSLIIPAFAEEPVIADKVANALALDYPRERLEIVVVCDGSPDGTAQRAKAAGADVVLEVPRAGKVIAQDRGVAASKGSVVAFSDANAFWDPDALGALVRPFADPAVAYVCGQVQFAGDGDNQEGLYWRHEMQVRALESARSSVTAGNGAIYAVRRSDYVQLGAAMSHDLAFPFTLVKRGRRAVETSHARATEQMVPTLEGEFSRKRRMMSRAWPIVVRGGMLDPRGYPPIYALMIFSHRVLRYASPFLHVWFFVATLLRQRRSRIARAALAGQVAVGGAATLGPAAGRLGLVARYYVLTTASIAVGAADWLRYGAPAAWSPAEGTRT